MSERRTRHDTGTTGAAGGGAGGGGSATEGRRGAAEQGEPEMGARPRRAVQGRSRVGRDRPLGARVPGITAARPEEEGEHEIAAAERRPPVAGSQGWSERSERNP